MSKIIKYIALGGLAILLLAIVGIFYYFQAVLKPANLAMLSENTPSEDTKPPKQIVCAFNKRPSAENGSSLQLLSDSTGKLAIRHAEYAASKELRPELRELLQTRKEYFIQTAQTNPEAAIFYALPQDIRKELAKISDNCLEAEATLQGRLNVTHYDYENGEQADQYELAAADGKVYAIYPAIGLTRSLESGALVKVRGIQIDNLVLFNGSKTLAQASDFTGGIDILEMPGNPPALGEQKIIIILVYFADTEMPKAEKSFYTAVLGELNNYYKENSYGKLWVTGNVAGWYKLASGTACKFPWSEAVAAADNDVNFKEYNRVFVVTPVVPKCSSGFGTIGKITVPSNDGDVNASFSVVRAFSGFQTFGHEFGHNLGNHHANFLGCRTENFQEGCRTIEYGDFYDILGSDNAGHFNAIHKEYVGWFGSGNLKQITTSGRYTLEPIETATNGLKAIKIQRGSKDFLYVEYRQPIGYDKSQIDKAHSFSGGLMHTLSLSGEPNKTLLIGPTPPTNPHNPVLPLGGQYIDTLSHALIKVVGIKPEGLTLDVIISKTDFTAPGITFSSPKQNATISGQVEIAARISHPKILEKVEFFYMLNGDPILFGTAKEEPYRAILYTNYLSNGVQRIMAKATDKEGVVGQSEYLSVVVKNTDNNPPRVDLILPQNQSSLKSPARFIADAADDSGINKVIFVIDAGSKAERKIEKKVPPFDALAEDLPIGKHSVYAEAEDYVGKTARTETVSFTIVKEYISSPPKAVILPESVKNKNKNVPPPKIITDNLPNGKWNSIYMAPLALTGGLYPFSGEVVSGSLPPGIQLEIASGRLFGVPSFPGTYNFTVRVIDGLGQSDSKNLSVVIEGSSGPKITTASLPPAKASTRYDFQLTGDPGAVPSAGKISSGSLPPGMFLDSTSMKIYGTPEATGTYVFTITVKDALERTISKQFTLEVTLH